MAYWPGAHGGGYDHSRGWYAPIQAPMVFAAPPLPPGRPPPAEAVYHRANQASYALVTVPPDFRVGARPSETPTSPPLKALPAGLLADIPHSPTATSYPQVPSKKDVSFDDTIVNEFVEWADGKRECLSPMASSDFGFDWWTYELRRKPPPSTDQEDRLKRRIWDLANESPLKLWQAIQARELRALLGPGFEWVQLPENW